MTVRRALLPSLLLCLGFIVEFFSFSVYWAKVAFAEELFPRPVSQLCAEDHPPLISEHKDKMLPGVSVLKEHIVFGMCFTSITEPKS